MSFFKFVISDLHIAIATLPWTGLANDNSPRSRDCSPRLKNLGHWGMLRMLS